MRANILQHVEFEDIGSMQGWFERHKVELSYTRFHQAPQPMPSLADFDLLIALGGPMSVNDEHELPWLIAEKRLIRDAILAGRPVLGICLGAQLIANALGARVYAGPRKEIGWFPVEATVVAPPAAPELFAMPASLEVFHWHGETFDLPAGAMRLARSAVCENQAFQIGARVLGLQFHLETTPESVEAMIAHCGHELIENEFIQNAATLRKSAEAYERIHCLMDAALDFITRR